MYKKSVFGAENHELIGSHFNNESENIQYLK